MLKFTKPISCTGLTHCALAALLWLCWIPLQAAQVNGVRMHEAPDYTRVVFDTSAPVRYKLFTLKNPQRVVIDVLNSQPSANFSGQSAAVGRKRVRGLRTAMQGNDFRVVLDVSQALTPTGFTLNPVQPYGDRLVVDLYLPKTRKTTTTAPATAAPRGGGGPSTPKRAPKRSRDVLVAIDPGHGGEDPGAVGPNKALEKQVALQVSRRVVAQINAKPGMRAKLVRDGDYYVSLRKRTEIAREQRADLFVSIHADAFDKASVTGASVYTLSEKGGSSETARWLAAKENRSDLIGGVGDVTLGDKDDTLRQVLVSMSMDASRSMSIEAGRSVLAELGSVVKLHKGNVEQAGFVVLKSPDIPSLLVELGYLSNPSEARKLVTREYQTRLAKAVAQGIANYLQTAAPPGTSLAARSVSRKHPVTSGETLSGLASRYGTSMRKIKLANDLGGDHLRIGQVLVIPSS